MLDLTELRTLLAVVDEGGISAAARRMHLSTSALSDRIKGMEDRAGFALLTRNARGSVPTPAGVQLAKEARKLLVRSEHLHGIIRSWRARAQGELMLHVNSNAIASFVPDILAHFLRKNSDVRVRVREALSEEIASNVRSGEADIGIAAGNVDLSGLLVYPFRRDKLVLLVPQNHSFSNLQDIDFLQTLDEPFIGLDDTAAIQNYVHQQASSIGRTLNLRATLRGFDGVVKMVAAGAGVAIVPVSVVSTSTLLAGARVIALRDKWAIRDLVICTQDITPLPDLTEALLQTLLESCDTECDMGT